VLLLHLRPGAGEERSHHAANHDGFELREGPRVARPGEVLGTRQTGMLQFGCGLARDQDLLERIPTVARQDLKSRTVQAEKLISRWIGDSTRFAGCDATGSVSCLKLQRRTFRERISATALAMSWSSGISDR